MPVFGTVSILKDQKASVISELSLSLPLILALIFGVIDLGALAQDYMMVEQAAREGVRTAGRLSGLETVTHNSASAGVTTYEANACNQVRGGPLCDHVLVHARIRHVLLNHNALNVDMQNVQVATDFNSIPVLGAATANDDSVAVQIIAPFQGFFLRYNINVTYRGPYLFQRVGT